MDIYNKNNLNLLAKNTLYYIIGLILTNIIIFISFPILARHLSTSDFGIFDLYSTISIFISVLLIFGIDSSVGRFFHEYTEIKQRKKLVSEALLIQFIYILIIVSVLLFLVDYIVLYFGLGELHSTLLGLSVLQAAFQALLNYSLSLLKWSSEKRKFIFLSLVSSGLGLGFIVIGIYSFDPNIIDIFEYIIYAKVISAVVGIFLIRKWLTLKNFNFEYTIKLLKFSTPVGVACIIEVLIPILERSSIFAIINNAQQLGQYAAAAKICAIFYVFIQAFQNAWGPLSLANHHNKNIEDFYSLTSKFFVMVVCLCSLLLTYIGKFTLNLIASERYEDGFIIIFPLTMSLAFHSVGLITGMGVSISLKTKYQILSNIVQLLSVLLLISALSNSFGILGIAVSIMASSAIKLFTATTISYHLHKIYWPFREIIYTFVITIIIGITLMLIIINCNQWILGAFAFITTIGFFCWFWGYSLNKNERELVYRVFNNK